MKLSKLILLIAGTLVISGTVPEKPIKVVVTKNNVTYTIYKAL